VASQITATLREPMMLARAAPDSGIGGGFEGLEERIAETQADSAEHALPRPKTKMQQLQQGIFEHVSEHIRREPAQSTRLLEAWIGSSEEIR
jgi:flagellar M-ring protein FliF